MTALVMWVFVIKSTPCFSNVLLCYQIVTYSQRKSKKKREKIGWKCEKKSRQTTQILWFAGGLGCALSGEKGGKMTGQLKDPAFFSGPCPGSGRSGSRPGRGCLSPRGPLASQAVTWKTSRRPSTWVSSARQVTSIPHRGGGEVLHVHVDAHGALLRGEVGGHGLPGGLLHPGRSSPGWPGRAGSRCPPPGRRGAG